jgi:hypothetical protein
MVAKKSLCLPLLAYDSTSRPSWSLITILTEIFWPSLITVDNSMTSEPASKSSFMNIQSLHILPCRIRLPCCDNLPVCNERPAYITFLFHCFYDLLLLSMYKLGWIHQHAKLVKQGPCPFAFWFLEYVFIIQFSLSFEQAYF